MLTKESFNKRLKSRRKKMGYTQEQLSEILKIKRDAYAYYETDTFPPVPVLHDICKALNCTADYLIFDPEQDEE